MKKPAGKSKEANQLLHQASLMRWAKLHRLVLKDSDIQTDGSAHIKKYPVETCGSFLTNYAHKQRDDSWRSCCAVLQSKRVGVFYFKCRNGGDQNHGKSKPFRGGDHQGCQSDQKRPSVLSPPMSVGQGAVMPTGNLRPGWAGRWEWGFWGRRGPAWICAHSARDTAVPRWLRCPFSKTDVHKLLAIATDGLAPKDKNNQIMLVFEIQFFFQIQFN